MSYLVFFIVTYGGGMLAGERLSIIIKTLGRGQSVGTRLLLLVIGLLLAVCVGVAWSMVWREWLGI